jgi:hypothetical protein
MSRESSRSMKIGLKLKWGIDEAARRAGADHRRLTALWISSRRDSKSGGEERLNSKWECELNRQPVHSC